MTHIHGLDVSVQVVAALWQKRGAILPFRDHWKLDARPSRAGASLLTGAGRAFKK